MSANCDGRARERGQATVEFALVVPLVLIALLTVLQVAVLAYGQLTVTFAAREAVRMAATDPTTSLDVVLAGDDIELVVEIVDQHRVQVSARAEIMSISPLFDPFFDGRNFEATAVAMIE